MPDPALDWLDDTWKCIAALGADLTPDQWQLPTDCPGWTIHDQLAHITGTERYLSGEALPRDPMSTAYTKNPLGEFNEAWVEYFRGLTGPEMLDEFVEVTSRRLRVIRSFTDEQLNEEVVGPVGPMPWREFLRLRTFDCHSHEQDIRRAVGRPGHLDGRVATHSVERCFSAMPKVVAKTVGAPDGTVFAFVVHGRVGGTKAVRIQNGRGSLLQEAPQNPTGAIAVDVETFLCLCWGRWDAAGVTGAGRVTLGGDQDLAGRVLAAMNILF